MRNLFKRRYAATPIKWKLLGDAILYACCGSSIPAIVKQDMYLSIGLIVAGIVGFYLSNLPVEDKKENGK